ncbi:uncharacterized protein LOC115997766 isoform X3 [Ipomoea triloba]|uniref:uncharacterized protein LOC115997766 isoform X3 n=1 Tax=Ipomoea triloba TaxID=35885 RepID=UPI00125D86D9|nr:uncharacterized protein LOC115997766 isoform X3 [Ipomoea triloba]XP_031093150.1 uncharacterized protein LOC115997766 isoform X3 [Ipomoea triloba]XP_031093151.1 uncharacterized protein LOC115997766 isoform X3 [Ipomoea triloba]
MECCIFDMKIGQDSQKAPKKLPSRQTSHDSQNDQQNNTTETPVADAGSVSASGNGNRKISREDIELVQNLIERCLQLYMNRDEVVKTLLNRAKIAPAFTTLVWRKLEEQNADFFRSYYIRLKLKKQILLFNQLLEQQYVLTKHNHIVPLAPLQNRINCMPVNNLPMGYPVLQQPPIPAAGHLHLDSMTISSFHVVNGVPAPCNYYPVQMNSGNDMVIETSASDMAVAVPHSNAYSSMADMPISPASVASSGHFPFTGSEILEMGVDTSALDTAFPSHFANSAGLQLPSDNCAGNSLSSGQFPWMFSFSDLTEDLPNLEADLGDLGNYHGSTFLHSGSDILLDSPEQEDLVVDEFFVDFGSGPTCPQTDEEKP